MATVSVFHKDQPSSSPPPDPRAAGTGPDDFVACPRCGSEETLEDLESLLEDLMNQENAQKNRHQIKPSGIRPKQLDIAPQRLVPAEHRTCTGCGSTWNFKAKRVAERIKSDAQEIYERTYGAVDRLAHLEDPKWQKLLKKIAQ